ncbi:phosphopantetheine-binding protein, partial [Kitasatospora sp. NPDC058965]|uniref:phosphopantetheine-binding protein n=1 Tax=Kitasatospora sp. NPDC058965 TaxID=3346682 RepID=UPI0036A93029
ANTYLDALAHHRTHHGHPTTALAYGLWNTNAGLSAWLGEADLQRLTRQGLPALSVEEALGLFDTALATPHPVQVPLHVNPAALRTRTDELPALLRGLAPAVRRRSAKGAADPAALRRRLAGLGEPEREEVLLELVRTLAAGILGHAGAAEVHPERDFLEAGFDSLASMELRNGLNEATGLRLPPMVVFDNKNPNGLAGYLRSVLDSQQPSEDGSTPVEVTAGETLTDIFRGAVQSGQTKRGLELLRAVAGIRPRFASAAEYPGAPGPVRLLDGPAGPRLLCLSSPMATSGALQHKRVVSHLSTPRPVYAIPMAGFHPGESLPDSPEAAIDLLAATVLKAAEGEPFVLMGYSAGGIFAHATARHLAETAGVRPAGMVMLDTYEVNDLGGGPVEQLLEGMFHKEGAFGGFDSTRLSAMGGWGGLIPHLDLGPLDGVPGLHIQCIRSFFPEVPDAEPDAEWISRPWNPEYTLVPVKADHFSLIEENAALPGRAIEEWLTGHWPAA